MGLTDTELRSIEELARIRLSDESRAKLGAQLERIIGFVEHLRSIETSPGDAEEDGDHAASPPRDDLTEPCLPADEALAAAPEPFHGMFKVPPVIETGDR